MAQGRPVVSCADGLDDVQALLDLGPEAAERGVPVVVGAGVSPGYTCLLARHAASWFDEIDEIHTDRRGTGGQDCARPHPGPHNAPPVAWAPRRWPRREHDVWGQRE